MTGGETMFLAGVIALFVVFAAAADLAEQPRPQIGTSRREGIG